MKLSYNLKYENDRYDYISEIGYMANYTYEVTDEPFDMETVHLYRWDKNIQAWVEGEIDEETGEWKLKTDDQ
jgi:hypothetical protein